MRSHHYFTFFATLLWCFINMRNQCTAQCKSNLIVDWISLHKLMYTHSYLYFCRLARAKFRNEKKLLWACYSRDRRTSIFSQCPTYFSCSFYKWLGNLLEDQNPFPGLSLLFPTSPLHTHWHIGSLHSLSPFELPDLLGTLQTSYAEPLCAPSPHPAPLMSPEPPVDAERSIRSPANI